MRGINVNSFGPYIIHIGLPVNSKNNVSSSGNLCCAQIKFGHSYSRQIWL